MDNKEKMNESGIGRKIMLVCALFKDQFSLDWLLDVIQVRASEILNVLETAVKQGILNKIGSSHYCFINIQTKNELLKSINAQERNLLNAEVIKVLVRELPESDLKIEQVSHHCLHTANDVEGCRWLISAGDLYFKKTGFDKARKFFFKAIKDLLKISSNARDQLLLETVLKLIDIEEFAIIPHSMMDIILEAKKIADKQEDESIAYALGRYIIHTEFGTGIYDKPIERKYFASYMEDIHDLLRGYFKEHSKNYEDIISRTLNDGDGKLWALHSSRAAVYAFSRNYTRGMALLNRIYDKALRNKNQFGKRIVSFWIGNTLNCFGHHQDAIPYLKDTYEKIKGIYTFEAEYSPLLLAHAYFKINDIGQSVYYLEQFNKLLNIYHGDFSTSYPAMELGWAHEENKYPYVKGLMLKENLNRHLQSPHLITQGYAYYYKALYQRKNNHPAADILASLNESLNILEKSGFLPGIVNTKIMLIRTLLSTGEKEKAQKTKKSIMKYFPFFGRAIVPEDLEHFFFDLDSKESLLDTILDIGKEGILADNKTYVTRLLTIINRFIGAKRSAIFLMTDKEEYSPRPVLLANINITEDTISESHFQKSMHMIKEAWRKNQRQITSSGDLDYSPNQDAIDIGVRICVPLVIRNKTVGVLYIDHLRSKNTITEHKLKVVSFFASQVGFIINNQILLEENIQLKLQREEEKYICIDHIPDKLHFSGIIGESLGVKKMLTRIDQVSGTNATVLILGETGVGKEMVARAIHAKSLRADKPFVYIDCSTIPENLLAGELFGYEKGAFTGAVNKRIGRFQLADGGTIFLDEIGEISPDVQIKLLRVLQTKMFDMLGGTEGLRSDFRLILATNRDLENEVNSNKFRQDLFYRINVFPILVLPLRDRKDDIPLLALHFLKLYSRKHGRSITTIAKKEMEQLVQYDWPGNVRELENVIERNVILNHGNELSLVEFKGSVRNATDHDSVVTLADNERRFITQTLEKTGWRIQGKGGASEILNINVNTLKSRMKKLGIKKLSKTNTNENILANNLRNIKPFNKETV